MCSPHNGNIITIDHLTYYDPQSQTSPHTTISLISGNKTITSLTDVSPRVYKDSIVLGAYYGPPPIHSEPSSSSVCML